MNSDPLDDDFPTPPTPAVPELHRPRLVDDLDDRSPEEAPGFDQAGTADPDTDASGGELLVVRGYRPPVEQRAVIPDWLRDRDTRRDGIVWAAGYLKHWTLFHLARLPLYYARLVGRSPFGLWRLVCAVARWVADRESLPTREALLHSVSSDSRGAHDLWLVRDAHRRAVRFRFIVAGVMGAVLLTVGLVILAGLSTPTFFLTVATMLAVLGLTGLDTDKRITDRAADRAEIPQLTSEVIVTALASLGIAKINQAVKALEDKAIGFPEPIVRHGSGWRADIDLPHGVTAGDIIDRRSSLASGLRRKLGCVWPEGDPDHHEGRLVLFVADRPLSESATVAWPLMTRGQVDLFDPVPVGVNQRGEEVTVTLMFASGVIGAVPRMGKTFLLRLLCLAAALDPRTESHVFNFKGGADLAAFEHTAHSYRTGEAPDDIAYALAALRAVKADMARRYQTLAGLPKEQRPESKVTSELASHRSLGLWPVLVAVDECQKLFEDPEHGKEATEICADLVRRGPAVGIMAWFATQRPDADSLPKGIADNAMLRFCLKVMAQPANDMVLGTSMYKAGYRATMFTRGDVGIAYMAGEGNDPVIVRSAYIDDPAADTIALRAQAAKKAAEWLTGYAADEDLTVDDETDSILDHLQAVWPFGQDKVWCDTLAERLAEQWPGTYDAWSGEQVTSAVKPHGISTRQVKRQGQNKRGLSVIDLRQAVAERQPPPLELGIELDDLLAPTTNNGDDIDPAA